jgi:CheY-like chemotaxis protein/signal recognition particle receptor subunit beta
MALFNHATKEVTAKLVYYGPGLCGKTTNLQWIHDNLSFKTKGKLVSLATQTDRTLFFDFLPLELGTIRGMRTRMQIYTVPGQVFYEATRRMVLKGCDAVVFVADSQAAMLDANAESLQSLRRNLLANEIDPAIPVVIQYNKRDLPTALPIAVLNARLNPRGVPFYEGVAIKGTGVEETLKGITKLLFQWLSKYYGELETGMPSSTEVIAPAAPAAAPPTPVSVRLPHAELKAARPPAPTPAPPVARPPAEETGPAAGPLLSDADLPPTAVFAPQKPVTVPPPAVAQAPAAVPPAPTEGPATPPPAPPPPIEPKPTPRPAAPPAPLEEPPPETMVFVKPKPVTVPSAAPPRPQPVEASLPDTINIRPQPVVSPGTPAAKPAGPPASAPMTVPPPMPTSARFEAPKPITPPPETAKPAEWTPPVFKDTKPAAPAEPPPKGEGLREDQWLYLLDGTQRGPIDIEDLIDLVLTSIPEDSKVWHPGLEGWVRARQVRQIADEIPPPLPIPGAARGGYVEEDMPDFNTVPAMLRTVLIADEDTAFRKYLAMPLAAQGFTIYEAADGAAAWQLAVQNRPWMILADISMPEVDGFEFCRRVRNHALLSRKPLLFISGSDKYKDRYRALQIGADDFLSKQMPVRELLMRIQLLMTRYSDLSASGDQKQAGKAPVAGALEGRVEVFGSPALLQICNQGRLSGLFTASAEDADNTEALFGFREGEIVSAATGRISGPEAVYAFLGWEKGSFKFTPGDPGTGQPLAQSVEHLLLEGCRLLDEARSKDSGEGAAL